MDILAQGSVGNFDQGILFQEGGNYGVKKGGGNNFVSFSIRFPSIGGGLYEKAFLAANEAPFRCSIGRDYCASGHLRKKD